MQNYYQQFVAPLPAWQRPLGVEGKILGHLQMEELEFTFVGRYDRLDYCEDGLQLIDYKTSHKINLPSEDTVDLQLGLYYLGLEQRYGQRLQRMSLLYLRQGEIFSYEASEEHKQRVKVVIGDLAVRLRQDEQWEPNPGQHCNRCAYQPYCQAINSTPAPLPPTAKSLVSYS